MTVTSAQTAQPYTAPVSALTPDGISTLKTYAPLRLMYSTAFAYFPSGARCRPIPKMASTMISYSPSGIRFIMVHPYFSRIEICVSVSGEQRLRSPISQKSTGNPSCIRSLPTANPSPPLLPQPAAINVLIHSGGRSGETAFITSSAQARAARSIRTSEGTPKPSIVFRSHSFISAAVTRYSVRLSSILFLISVSIMLRHSPRNIPGEYSLGIFPWTLSSSLQTF